MDTLTASQYNIEVKVYHIVPGESECALFDCVWYPSLEVSVHPGSLLWPDDSCAIRMRTNENFIIQTDISDNDVKETLNGNEYLWEFTGKPSDCSPVITLVSEKHSFDFVLRLPYLSAWVVTTEAIQFEANQLEWKDSRPFARSVLEQVVEKDYNARIRFRLYSKECKFLFIYERSTNQVIRTLSFEEDGHDSIACSEILKWDIPVIRDKIPGKEAYLIELDEKNWSFYKIFDRAKKKFLYKNNFYYKTNKSVGVR